MNPGGEHGGRGPRFAAGLPAVLSLGETEVPATAHNISRTGLLVAARIPLPAPGEVEVRIRAPAGNLEVRLSGHVVRAEAPEGTSGEVRLALEFNPLPDDVREDLERLLARVMEGHQPGPLESLRPGATPPEIRKALEAIPVPHRITLAQRASTREREYLRLDPQAAVLEALARNPNLTAAEARALIALPHLLPSTLEILAADSRWSRDEDMKILIATHPRALPALCERLVDALSPAGVRKALQRASLSPSLRARLIRRGASR